MSRRMEHDADLYAARFIGPDAYAGAFERLWDIFGECERIDTQLPIALEAGALPESIPELLRNRIDGGTWRLRVRRVPTPRFVLRLAGLLSTHPPTVFRMEHAKRYASQGVYRYEAPSSSVFRNFDELCRQTTRLHCHARLGKQAIRADYQPVRQSSPTTNRRQEQSARLASGLPGRAAPGAQGLSGRIVPERA